MESSSLALKQLDPRSFENEFIKNGIRSDGRCFTDLRRVVVGAGNTLRTSQSSSCGESLVYIGATVVACTISVLVGTPCSQHPDAGDLDIDVSLWPICSLKYEQRSGKPEEAYLLESILHDVFVSGDVMDLTQLGIEKGRYAYRLHIRLVCISDDGNLIDAAILAVTRALLGTVLPRPIVGPATVSISRDKTTPLILKRIPVAVTCGIFNSGGEGNGHSSGSTSSSSSGMSEDVYLVDPSQEEEAVVRGTITCVIDTKAAITDSSSKKSNKQQTSTTTNSRNAVSSSLCLLLQVCFPLVTSTATLA